MIKKILLYLVVCFVIAFILDFILNFFELSASTRMMITISIGSFIVIPFLD